MNILLVTFPHPEVRGSSTYRWLEVPSDVLAGQTDELPEKYLKVLKRTLNRRDRPGEFVNGIEISFSFSSKLIS
jgi:hypothetical protein